MSSKYCSHIEYVNDIPFSRLAKDLQPQPACTDCKYVGPNLWLCLQNNCLHVGCSENVNDHSTIHYKCNEEHCVHINLSTKRIWCYICEMEVFFRTRSIIYEQSDTEEQRGQISTSTASNNKTAKSNVTMVYGDSGEENHSTDSDSLSELAYFPSSSGRPYSNVSRGDDRQRGLVGLQNIGNTCYMNAALQALSNTLPLTSYFLECSAALALTAQDKKPGLSRTYQQLIKEIWNRRTRGYVVPSGILYGVRNVYPMFRGYHQHDTQEFLRCFMDQLHEELKESALNFISPGIGGGIQHAGDWWGTATTSARDSASPSPSQSDGEYETCDSGVSERSSLSDDTEHSTQTQRIRRMSIPEGSTRNCKYGGSVIDTQPSGGDAKSQQKVTSRYRSIISDLFDGKLLSSVQCLTCDRISTRVETFQDLSLPIPGRDHITMLHQSSAGPKASGGLSGKTMMGGNTGEGGAGLVTCADAAGARDGWWTLGWLWGWFRSWFYGPAVSLHDCLAAFFSADELKGDNMYSCEKCNKLRNGVKFSKVIELPEILCIHLKRFRHELMFSSKISSYVSFPLTGLDMRPYLHRDCTSDVSEYELSSVICHHGTAGAGHYVCYALNHQRNCWFEFDDQCVTEVSPETVESCEAYVLFYRKCSRKINPIRQSVSELMKMQGAGDMRFYISRQWLTRFSTCAEPGPIDNTDFLCAHGAVRPARMAYVDRLVVIVSQPVWEYLLRNFRGGPTCSHLYACPMCLAQSEAHQRRVRYELEQFQACQRKRVDGDSEDAIYAISMRWFRSWQVFVKSASKEEPPPGPIDNSTIVVPGTANTIHVSSDYAQISEELWTFLYSIYGGGPIIQLRTGSKIEVPTSTASHNSNSTTTETIADQSPEETSPVVDNLEQIPLLKPTSTVYNRNSVTLSTSESDEEEQSLPQPSSTTSIPNTFIGHAPAGAHLNSELGGLKRPSKVFQLQTRRRWRDEYETSKRRFITSKRRSFPRRTSDDKAEV